MTRDTKNMYYRIIAPLVKPIKGYVYEPICEESPEYGSFLAKTVLPGTGDYLILKNGQLTEVVFEDAQSHYYEEPGKIQWTFPETGHEIKDFLRTNRKSLLSVSEDFFQKDCRLAGEIFTLDIDTVLIGEKIRSLQEELAKWPTFFAEKKIVPQRNELEETRRLLKQKKEERTKLLQDTIKKKHRAIER